MDASELTPRRSKREHQPTAKAVASFSITSASCSTSRRSQRRRVPPPSTSSLVTVTSPASSRPVSVTVETAVEPNGQRRRLRAAAHTNVSQCGVHISYPKGVHDDNKILGQYSSRECKLLCEVILSQLEKQTLALTVLDEKKSPAFIKWKLVAKTMELSHNIRMTPQECQLVWKFLAYGQKNVLPDGETEELLPDSEEEEFYQCPKEINARVAAEQVKIAEKKQEEKMQIVASDEITDEGQYKQNAATKEIAAKKSDEVQVNKANELEEKRESGIRLYPTYSLPTGAPDAWYRPFGPKDALPLTFVASRFLRRKPTPSPAQSRFEQSTVTTVPSATEMVDLKRKQAVLANRTEAAKKPKCITPVVSTPPRTYKPSSFPPLAVTRARSELDFFELRLREEQTKKLPGTTFALSAADVQRRFGEASAEVRRQCQTLAAYDVERFNRDILRVHARQKATTAGNTIPKPSVASTSSSASKPAASPSQTSTTT
ncbi:hypothetical protein KXD40_008999 [Peronospora effusa]|uniref:Uncharacterized protein n=1 Tax=Peronospora effusa TaxID=542832 RepID=A0A3M6VDV2_9STRA|nr:hypothetical protein DD238_006994 [Peronospora effusa]RQM14438.1 hypothetical protein DD237_005664 [Peronospora effusa]UIZ25304.1 hypothetical protein KXD40_008999 [Peronospora effusa]CAI5701301.1 unnamed protein product [Peronospora effusa]